MKLVLPLPPSANRYWRYVNGRVLKSAEAKDYANKCHWLVMAQSNVYDIMLGPVSFVATVYFPNKRGDLDNRIKQCLDALQGSAYVDDKQVEHLEFTRAIDKANPRVEVTLEEITE